MLKTLYLAAMTVSLFTASPAFAGDWDDAKVAEAIKSIQAKEGTLITASIPEAQVRRVRFDAGDAMYHVDLVAKLCFAHPSMGGGFALVPCEALKAYPQIRKVLDSAK